MQYPAQIQTAIDLLNELDAIKAPADKYMAGFFRKRRYIGARDKGVVADVVYGVIRQKYSLTWLVRTCGGRVSMRALVMAYLALEGHDLTEAFVDGQYAPGVVSKKEKFWLEKLDAALLDEAPAFIRYNVPEWLMPYMEKACGDMLPEVMTALNSRATTDIRINSLKTTRERLQTTLASAGVEMEATPYSPLGLRMASRRSLFGLEAFERGWFEVQDEGSQLLAHIVPAAAGDKVVDFCAGAGGKTLALAAKMENKGTLWALDIYENKLKELSRRVRRAGVDNVRTHVLSSHHDKWVKRHASQMDHVLVDAPCSGTGTWRRSPDLRWNVMPEDIGALTELQASILKSAARLVRPGGTLVYATCSLLVEENEDQVATFLKENPTFKCVSPHGAPDKACVNDMLRTWPHIMHTDGFFAATFVRDSAENDA